MKNCAIYTRSATSHSDETLLQRLSCEKYLLGKGHDGWALCGIYEDSGASGDTIQRPALQRLMRDIIAGEIDTVIVQGIDRLSRSASIFCEITSFLDKHNISLASVKQGCGTDTNAGRLMLHLMEAMAQSDYSRVQKAA